MISWVPLTTRAFGPHYPWFRDMRSFLSKIKSVQEGFDYHIRAGEGRSNSAPSVNMARNMGAFEGLCRPHVFSNRLLDLSRFQGCLK